MAILNSSPPIAPGQPIGFLIVLSRLPRQKNRHPYWTCQCQCGNTTIVDEYNLRTGHTKSCGCLRVRTIQKQSTKHGKAPRKGRPAEYSIWKNIRARTMNPRNKGFSSYGGRGIFLCSRWHEFENFFVDMGPRPSPAYSIERKDNNGPYSPENCLWGTRLEQANNKRNNILLTIKGETHTLAQWARIIHVRYGVVLDRFRRGLPNEEIIASAVRKRPAHLLTFQEKSLTVTEWAKILGKNRSTLNERLRRGWPIEKVLST